MIYKTYRYFKEFIVGSDSFLRYKKESKNSLIDIKEIYGILSKEAGDIDSREESPVFIFSSGWRCGSTLLQRLVVSGGYLIWGEPLSESAVIKNLFTPLLTIRSNYPRNEYYMRDNFSPTLKDKWIANLTPDLKYTLRATRSYIDDWCKKPALEAGVEQWGIKEVRWPAEYAYIFKALYPQAKFIFLIRNPLDAYASYTKHGKKWFIEYPKEPINNSIKYAKMWTRLTESFLKHSADTGGILLKYEDLKKEDSINKLELYLGTKVDAEVLKEKVGSSYEKNKKPYLPKIDQFVIKKICKETMLRTGYNI